MRVPKAPQAAPVNGIEDRRRRRARQGAAGTRAPWALAMS